MKEITIKIPNDKLDLFFELAEKLGLNISDEYTEIPEEHKAIVRERIKEVSSDKMVDWEDARKRFTYNKSKL